MNKRLECLIFGRVQLVMFRDFIRRKTKSLGLTGTVQNLSDGSVFVVAEGDETVLRRLIEFLKIGPLFAKVERLEEKWLPAKHQFSDFRIIY